MNTVNAARDHFQIAVDDLTRARLLRGAIGRLVKSRHSYRDSKAALQHHSPDEIKVVVEWFQGSIS